MIPQIVASLFLAQAPDFTPPHYQMMCVERVLTEETRIEAGDNLHVSLTYTCVRRAPVCVVGKDYTGKRVCRVRGT